MFQETKLEAQISCTFKMRDSFPPLFVLLQSFWVGFLWIVEVYQSLSL